MSITVTNPGIEGVHVIEADRLSNIHGHKQPSYQAALYASYGMTGRFINDEYVRAFKGSLLGLRYNKTQKNAQLFSLIRGHIYFAIVDVRRFSPTFGHHRLVEISDIHNKQIYISPGLAWGYCVMNDQADIHIKQACFSAPYDEASVFWQDPDIAIKWPLTRPTLSPKDREAPYLRDVAEKDLPLISDYAIA